MQSITRLVAVAAAFAKLAPKAGNRERTNTTYDSWSNAENRWATRLPGETQEASSPQPKVLRPKPLSRRPRITYDDIRKNVDPLIPSRGWAVHVTLRDTRGPGFAYSIGLVAKNLPELIMIGPLPADVMVDVIDTIAERFLASGIRAGDFLNIMKNLPVHVREIDPQEFGKLATASITWAARNNAEINRTMQVLFSDSQGRFPGDPYYDWIEQVLLPKPHNFSIDPPL